jgi:TRAP-type C4-dicarboxylate transport system substrate-binding protein
MMRGFAMVGAMALLGAAVTATSAQDLPATRVKVLVQDSPSPQTSVLEVPFWTKTVPEASGGQVVADVTPLDQLGVDDKAVLRLLKLGVFDFASFDMSKMAGDDPRFEGCDLAGISLDIATARRACDAYRETLDELMQQQWGAKLLAIGTAPPQVFWCKPEIKELDDLAGKKIRVFNRSMIDFLTGVGAEPVNINFREVVPALQRGVIDCGVTGTLVGNTGGWPEVTQYIYPMFMGWSINVHAANLNSWNRLDPAVQAFLTDQHRQFEDRFWSIMEEAIDDADNCNFGKEPCRMAHVVNMTLVPVSEADRARREEILKDSVLKNWAERAGAEAAAHWNATVGEAVGITVPVD